MREIDFYTTAAGHSPVRGFLNGLPTKAARKVWQVLDLVRTTDMVPPHVLKKLPGTGDLWEVRAQFGGNAYRLLGFFERGHLIVLVSGFVKKTEELPVREIALAQQRRRDYWERNRRDG
jgi:phage-related protein